MVSSIKESIPCHWCKQEKIPYARVIQLFQTIQVCSKACLDKYSEKAKTQVLDIKYYHAKQLKHYPVIYGGR